MKATELNRANKKWRLNREMKDGYKANMEEMLSHAHTF
jgi:hypothetical protein